MGYDRSQRQNIMKTTRRSTMAGVAGVAAHFWCSHTQQALIMRISKFPGNKCSRLLNEMLSSGMVKRRGNPVVDMPRIPKGTEYDVVGCGSVYTEAIFVE